jgi:hypothetical protein
LSREVELVLAFETRTDEFYDQYRNGEWLGSVRVPKDIYDDVLDHSTEHCDVFKQYDKATGQYLSTYMKLREPLWFLAPPREILAQHDIEVDQATADQLEDVFPGVDKYYYLYYLSTHDYKEAIKWILGPIASIAAKTGDSIPRICPAYILGEFVDALAAEKFPKHFAKEIFNRVLTEDNRSLTRIIADPKYMAVDTSVVDGAVEAVIADNPYKVEEAKANPKLVQWFVGQVLKANKGMSPVLVKEALERTLNDATRA